MPRALINGVELFYDQSGQGEAIIFHHGYTGSHDAWSDLIAPRLRDRYHCIVMDARGAGDSGHPASAIDVEAAAKSYTAALDNTKVTVITTWSPDNRSGSTVQVKVSYDFGTVLTPLASSNVLTVQTTAREIINQ